MITEGIEDGINKVLSAIKNDPSKLLDPTVKFFNDPESGPNKNSEDSTTKEKPMYLKDYHRMNLLSGGFKDDDEDEAEAEQNQYGTVDGEKPFVVTEREERAKLLSDIKTAFNDDRTDDDEGSDDDFLKKKVHVHQSRREFLEQTDLPDPNFDKDAFLDAFVDKKAWIPKENDKVIDLDRIDNDADEEFDDAVEKFEHAYNFRYEDANAAEIVSYARNQATLRRSGTNSRKRQREKEHELKEEEEKKREELLKKKKTAKVNEVADRLKKIKDAVGEEVSDEVIEKVFGNSLLNDDFDDADWDSKMAQIFDEQYYEAEPEKPQWSDMDDDEEEAEDHDEQEQEQDNDEEEKEVTQPGKKSKKDKLKEKKSKKKEKQSIKDKAEEIVESNTLKILSEVVEEERGRSKNKDEEVKFKYREVSPEAFGLTTRDIILADDKQLNNFIGLKKFAPYRPKELRVKDKRKYAKSKNLREWRKETFSKVPRAPEDNGQDIWIPMEGEPESNVKDKKHKKEKKSSKGDRKHKSSKK